MKRLLIIGTLITMHAFGAIEEYEQSIAYQIMGPDVRFRGDRFTLEQPLIDELMAYIRTEIKQDRTAAPTKQQQEQLASLLAPGNLEITRMHGFTRARDLRARITPPVHIVLTIMGKEHVIYDFPFDFDHVESNVEPIAEEIYKIIDYK